MPTPQWYSTTQSTHTAWMQHQNCLPYLPVGIQRTGSDALAQFGLAMNVVRSSAALSMNQLNHTSLVQSFLHQMEALTEPKTTIIALGTALLAVFMLHTIVQWHRLSHVPGPFWAAFSKYWMIRTALGGQQPAAIKEVNDKYGMSHAAVAHSALDDYLFATRNVDALQDLSCGLARMSWRPMTRMSCGG